MEFVKVGVIIQREKTSGYSTYTENDVEWTHWLDDLPPGTEIAVRVPKGTVVRENKVIVFE
jgi:hypothetical protein